MSNEEQKEQQKRDPRARNWVFTVNNWTEDDVAAVKALVDNGATYVSCGKEVGESGTPHLQGVAAFKSLKSRSQLSKLLRRAYLAPKAAKSTFAQWANYTQKEDAKFFEHGERPKDPAERGALEVDRWKDAFEAAAEDRWDDVPHSIRVLHLRNLQHAAEFYTSRKRPREVELDDVSNEWHFGVAGAGKSKAVRERYAAGGVYRARSLSPDNWGDYDGEETVLFDDVDEHRMSGGALGFLKDIADVYPIKVGRKYLNDREIRPKHVVVTTNVPFERLVPPVHRDAMARRFQFFHWTEPYYVEGRKSLGRNPKWEDITKAPPGDSDVL